MSDLFEGQPLLEGFGVFSQDKKSGIAFIVFFGRMRVMKMVIQFVVGKMPVDKMGIGFQSHGMITSLMLMGISILTVAMRRFRMIMNERKQKERNNDPQKDRFP